MYKYIKNKFYTDGFDVYKCYQSNVYHAILVCIQDNQGNENEKAYKVKHDSLTNDECFKQGVSLYCWDTFHKDMVIDDEPHPKLKRCHPEVDKYLFKIDSEFRGDLIYQEFSESYDNDVLNVKLNDDEVVKLLEITWVPCSENGHRLMHAIVKDRMDDISIISTDEIKLPEPYLITNKIRKIVAENGGDLESVEGDANYMCIYG